MSLATVVGNMGAAAPAVSGKDRRPAALTLRLATPADFIPLAFFFDTALRKDYFLRRGQLADMLKGKYHQVYIAQLDSILVGVAILTGGTRLVNVLVHPAYRGLGIGRELVSAGCVSEVRAKLDMSSGDPRAFYEAVGFARTGEFNQKGNVEIMRLRQRKPGGRRTASSCRRPNAPAESTSHHANGK